MAPPALAVTNGAGLVANVGRERRELRIKWKPIRTAVYDNRPLCLLGSYNCLLFTHIRSDRPALCIPQPGEADMDQLELRYQAIQCHVRAQRMSNEDDARWLVDLASKLSAMADVEQDRQIHTASRILRPDA